MKKRFIALLLAVLLVMSLAPQTFAASIDDYPNGVNVMIRSETPHADGRVVDTEDGKLSSNGIYETDANGMITIMRTAALWITTTATAPAMGSIPRTKTVRSSSAA